MHNFYIKKLLYVVLLLLSPLASLVLFGAAYVIIRLVSGMELLAAISSFKSLIYALIPYFPYLTVIPVVLILPLLILRKWSKMKK